MAKCLISFGANIGDAAGTIHQAAVVLAQRVCQLPSEFRLSRLFKTPPVGGPAGQPPFINAVAAIETSLSPWHVWQAVREVEQEFGRVRNQRWEARKLDLDILLYDQERIWTPHLKIPHPRMCMRRFILLPACDVAAEWLDPVSQLPLKALAARLQNRPASLCVVASAHLLGTPLLADVAQQARATILRLDSDVNSGPVSRWLCQLASERALADNEDPSSLFSLANLRIWLVADDESQNSAWEDRHRALAVGLGMKEAAGTMAWPIGGARYLLATTDLKWANHELVSALEAMDCPVEVAGG